RTKSQLEIRNQQSPVKPRRLNDLFCHEGTGRCDNIIDAGPLYFDDDHLSNFGARRVVPRIVEAIIGAGSETLN
ncbi:SGNH hydrolase domain-containing protein, partial [Celeribacter sp. ULVN23_4]